MNIACLLMRTVGWVGVSLCLAAAAQAQTVDLEQVEQGVPAAAAIPEAADIPAQELQRRAQARSQAREGIAAQRAAIAQRLEQAEGACWQRFAVEDCLRDVRAQARSQTNVLRDRELLINSEERQERAQERLRSIAQKQQNKTPTPMTSSTKAPQQAPAVTPQEAQAAQAQRESQAQQRAQAQARRLQAHAQQMQVREAQEALARQQRVQDAQERQESAQERRERAAKEAVKRRGQPLPVPSELVAP